MCESVGLVTLASDMGQDICICTYVRNVQSVWGMLHMNLLRTVFMLGILLFSLMLGLWDIHLTSMYCSLVVSFALSAMSLAHKVSWNL